MIPYLNTTISALALWLAWFLILAPGPHRRWEDKVLFVFISALFFSNLHLLGYTPKEIATGLLFGLCNLFFLGLSCLTICCSSSRRTDVPVSVCLWATSIYFLAI